MTGEEFATRLRAAAERRVERELRAEMGATVADAENRAKARLSGAVLNVRAGYLRRSIVGLVDAPTGLTLVGRVRAGGGTKEVSYARIHEEGGTIRPRNGRFLAIPTDNVPGGMTKVGPRDIPNLRFVEIRGGAMGMLVRDRAGRGKAGTGARADVMFWLVHRVDVPKRPYLLPSVQEASADFPDRMREAVNRALVAR